MRKSLVPLIAGVLLVIGAIYSNESRRRTHAEDVRGIGVLRERLDSTRAALVVAPTAADSTRLTQEVTQREFFLARREFHVAIRQEQIDAWWTLTGPGTLSVVGGAALLLLAVARLRRNARAGA